MRQKFKEYVTDLYKIDYAQCNLPWTMNAIGQTNFNNQSCKRKSILKQSLMNMKFFNDAAKYEIRDCKGKSFANYFNYFFLFVDWSIAMAPQRSYSSSFTR